METGFKVVIVDGNGEYHSVYSIKDGSVKYVPGVWTKPNENCGPLAVFKTFSQATTFHSRCWNRCTQIWGVEFISSTAQELYSMYEGRKIVMSLRETPLGTLLAEKVKMWEVIS